MNFTCFHLGTLINDTLIDDRNVVDKFSQNGHAQPTLRKAGEIEMRDKHNASQLAIELSKAQSLMVELEWYKERREN